MLRRTFIASAGLAAAAAKPARITFRENSGSVDVLANGQPLTTFHYDHAKWDKPFLHPLRAASGKVISRGWPVDPKPGESNDHTWHRGIFWGHGDVNKHDFWREQGRRKTSTLAVQGKPRLREMAGILEARMDMRIPSGQSIGTVEQIYLFEHRPEEVSIQATITVAADKGEALRFGDTDDGGFAFRLSDPFREDKGALLQNSEGLQTTEKIWGKNARWIDYSAKADGEQIGVSAFDHPSNLRHPTGWHARGYSLASANPFALGSFTKNKANDGSFTLKAGDRMRFRYCIVIHSGESAAASIEDRYRRFAQMKSLK